MQGVRAVIDDIDSLEKELRQRLLHVLTLQSRISETAIVINQVIDRVEAVLEHKRRPLFALDAEPLWTAILAPGQKTVTAGQIIETWMGYRAAGI